LANPHGVIRRTAWLACCWLLAAPCATAAQDRSITQRFATIAAFWGRGVIVVALTKPVTGRAIVDTGGATESRKQHPKDFDAYYHGLPIQFAIGPDFLARRRILLAYTGAGKALRVPLDVATNAQDTLAFVSCTAGAARYRMLLDTAAFAWLSSDTNHAQPIGVTLVSSQTFAALRADPQSRPGPTWQIMNESGHFVNEPSLIASSLTCGDVTTRHAMVVERSDNTTYQHIRKEFGLTVDGDVGLGGLPGLGWTLDFPARLLTIHR
jgi:hypothetical protein